MRYLVRFNDIKEKIAFFETQLDSIIEDINNIEKIKRVVIWEGDGANSFITNIDDYVSKLRLMQDKILESIKFLTTFYDSYGSEYERLTIKYANMNEGVINND